jgi:hypothetical protein
MALSPTPGQLGCRSSSMDCLLLSANSSIKIVETLREMDLMVIDGAEQQPEIDWMSPIKTYLDNQPISDDNMEIERITHKSRMYHLITRVLYRQGTNDMMMKCISKDGGSQLLRDIHSGVCGAHSSWCSIDGKVFRHKFYWSIAKDDAMEIITKCKDSYRNKLRSM